LKRRFKKKNKKEKKEKKNESTGYEAECRDRDAIDACKQYER